jgi:hypothetical protein
MNERNRLSLTNGEAQAIVGPLVDEMMEGVTLFMDEAAEPVCICSCHHIGLGGRAHNDVCEVMCES